MRNIYRKVRKIFTKPFPQFRWINLCTRSPFLPNSTHFSVVNESLPQKQALIKTVHVPQHMGVFRRK